MQENYLKRPRTKPQETLKGKMNKWDNGYAEFIPQGTRENQRLMLHRNGDSSFYKTEGKRESSYTLHINIDAASDDPVADMFDQFLTLTDSYRKHTPALPTDSQGRMLLDDGTTRIWLDTQHAQVSILSTLPCTPQIERQLLHAQADMSRAIGRYYNQIISSTPKN